ncbi:hypothetical protein D3C85_1168040 [compost metagenome]
MMSLERRASRIIWSMDWVASPTSGCGRFSQRSAESPQVTMAAIGCVTSWAMDAASSPSVVMRITCASSVEVRCSACWVWTAVVMSISAPTYSV